MTKFIRMGVDAIIRPPRAQYPLEALPPLIEVPGVGEVFREPIQFRNPRGLDIVGSYYAPPFKCSEPSCVVYLHGNASCQLEGLFLVPIFVPAGVSVLCFDFSGCGNSGGDYISLGMFEKDDVKCAIEYVRSHHDVGRVAIWGRSMGAATAFFTVSDDPTIACAVCDSPFASLSTLIRDLASAYHAPGFLTSLAVSYLNKKIRSLAGFKIKDLNPIEAAPMCFSPLFLIHGESDTFISPRHSREIFAKYPGEKEMVIVAGADHASARPPDVLIRAIMFIARALDAPVVIEDVGALAGSAGHHFGDVQEMVAFGGG
jgi:pimeloyl-ACP methyl ester carboxylesterase